MVMLRIGLLGVLLLVESLIVIVFIRVGWLKYQTNEWLLDGMWLGLLGGLATAIGGIIAWLLTIKQPPVPAPPTDPSSNQTRISVGGGVTPGGDFVGRDKNTVNYTFNQQIYQGQEPDAPADKIHIYRQWLVERYGNIPLEVIEQAASDASQSYQQVSIESVYVALDTTTRVSEEALLRALESGQPLIREPDERMNTRDQRALSALAATALHRRLVLLGGPGSGKTTFGNRLVVALAERNWQGMEGWPERLRDCLPVVVTLRFFARWLAGQEHKPSPGLLCSFIREELEDHSLDFVWSLIEQDLNGAERVFLFLDGLDEVPASVRKTLLDTVDAFQKRYTAVRMLITCRIASYEDRSWQLPSNTYAVETLALLDREKIERFVETWYQVMAERWKRSAVEMRDRAAQLRDALFRPGSDLFRLARNPLLLTQMALVHAHNKRLPDHRAKLYDEVVEILVGRWDERRLDGEAELSRHLQAGQCELEMLIDELRRVAWEAHGRMVTQIDVEGDGGADERVADLYESQLREDLAVLHQPKPSFDWSTELIDIMRRRTGLLVEQEPKRFTFPHRTFQEFLAGSYLACEPNFASNALDKVKEGAFWREVVLLAVGYQVHVRKEIDAPLSLVAELCPAAIPADGDESAWQSVRIAGEALLEMGLNRVRLRERGRELLERVQLRLLGLVEKGLLTAKERVRCGDVLGKLGDPRFDPERLFLPRWFHGKPEPRFGFVEIRKGLFVMGSSPEEIEALKQEEHGLPGSHI